MGTRSHFVSAKPVRIEIDDEWIEIKAQLTFGERNRLLGEAVKANVGDAKNGTVGMDIANYLNTLLDVSIVNWHLFEPVVDEQGNEIDRKPVAFDRALIGQFSADDPLITKVLEDVQKRYPLS